MNNNLRFLILLVLSVFIWSGINPHDRFTWLMEVLPAVIGFIVLSLTFYRFRFTDFCYFFIALHMILLLIGGHYTYAQVPVFNWIRDTFELTRNHYDRVGHFAQGFIPALLTREILLRTTALKKGKMLFFIVAFICLGISAFYELIEWWVSIATGSAAEAFLGTQGDIWDTQWDMFLALLGAVTSQLLLSRIQDQRIERMDWIKLF